MEIRIAIIRIVPFVRCVLRAANPNHNVPILSIRNNVQFRICFFHSTGLIGHRKQLTFLLRLTPKMSKWYKIIVQRRKKWILRAPTLEDFLKGVIECNCKAQKSIVRFITHLSLSRMRKKNPAFWRCFFSRDKSVF